MFEPIDTAAATAMPREVADAFALLSAAQGGVSEAGWAVRSAVLADRRVGDLAEGWVEEELRVLEVMERVKAWVEFVGLGALRRLREAVGERVRDLDDRVEAASGRGMSTPVRRAEADAAAVDEVVLAVGLPQWQVERRLDLAVDEDGRGWLLHGALAQGRMSVDRAVRIHQDTRGLGVEEVHAITERLLAPNRDGSVRTDRAFRRELRRQVAVHTPDPQVARDDAVADRTAYASVDPVGTGSVTVTGEAGRVVAAMERVDDVARRLRGDGDARTLTQLRSDVALDLLLYGWVTGDQPPGPGKPPTTAGPAGPAGPAGQFLGVAGSGGRGVTPPASTAAALVGQPPPARVSVVVSLGTLLGQEHGVGEIPGYGFISGDHARQLATARGSVWQRIVTDPVTGAALDVSTHRYRPTPAMARTVAALDAICRAPGCTTSADRCDVDHDRPWPAGPTRITNLSAKHRRHHNHKTRGTWRATTDPDGTILWRTLSGRTYLTRRHHYDDPLGRPVTDTELDHAATHAAATTTFDDPPPY